MAYETKDQNSVELEELLAEVGLALNAWSSVELNLSAIFGALIPVSFDVAHSYRTPFDTITLLSVRVDFVRGLITSIPGLDKSFRTRGVKVMRRIKALQPKRHSIAHFSLHGANPPTIAPFLTSTSNLKLNDDGTFTWTKPNQLSAQQIRKMRWEFVVLASELYNLFVYLAGSRGIIPVMLPPGKTLNFLLSDEATEKAPHQLQD